MKPSSDQGVPHHLAAPSRRRPAATPPSHQPPDAPNQPPAEAEPPGTHSCSCRRYWAREQVLVFFDHRHRLFNLRGHTAPATATIPATRRLRLVSRPSRR
eukprot:7382542-Prymnesium_polylepis.2